MATVDVQKQEIELTKQDLAMVDAPPNNAITFFEGCDAAVVAPFLKERLDEIVSLNPWLAGWLDKKGYHYRDDDRSLATLRVCAPGEAALSRETPRAELEKALGGLLVKPGRNGPTEALFKVSLVPDAGRQADRFALVFSMSHAIGDGHTFYRVHNMLSQSGTPQALVATRRPGVITAFEDLLGDDRKAMEGCCFMLPFMGKYILSSCSCAQMESRAFYLNEDWIKEQKETEVAQDGQVPFVSTNDIVTSWFLRKIEPNIGTMVVNFRGRVEEAEDTLAGNYMDQILYRPADYATAALIRKSLGNCRRAATPPSRMPPSFCETCRGPMAISTSWATFAVPVELPGGAAQTLHLPHFSHFDAPMMVNLIIFRAMPGKLACLLIGSKKLLAKFPDKGELIGEPVM